MIRVLVVDDHHVVRSGLTTLLNADPEIEVVADADNGRTAIAAVEAKRPDVILMDLSMPGMDGVEATAYLTTHVEGSKVLVLTSFADRERVQEAVAAGAIGYLLKDCEPAELLAAVRSAAAGHVPIDPRVAGALLPSGPSMTAEVVISPERPRCFGSWHKAWPTSRWPARWASPSARSRPTSLGCTGRLGCWTAPARPCGPAITCHRSEWGRLSATRTRLPL